MSERVFTADEITKELGSLRDRWLGYLGNDAWPKADRIMLMLLFMVIQDHFKAVANLDSAIWHKEAE